MESGSDCQHAWAMLLDTQVGFKGRLRKPPADTHPRFGRTPLGRIKPVHVRKWVARLAERGLGLFPGRQAYQVLSAILASLVESGFIAGPPASV
jgi:hypothetical protein